MEKLETLVGGLQARIDELAETLPEIRESLAIIRATCPACRALVEKHDKAIFEKNGLLTRLTAVEQGRVDTLSVKSVIAILTAVGTLAGAMGAAIATAVASMK